MRLTIGRPNAVVLPVPVRDCTSRSLPSLTGLNTAVCTGVGAKYPMSSIAALTSGWRPRSSKLGALGSAGISEVLSVVWFSAAIIAAASATPFSVGVVPFVIDQNLAVRISEVIQSECWSGRGARVRRTQATSLVAAGRSGTEAELRVHVIVLARSGLR